MKTLSGKSLLKVSCGLAIAVLLLFASAARAQNAASQQQEEAQPSQNSPAPNDAVGLLMQLNLSPEQIAQMREIRSQSAPEARAINRRLNQARRALDEAIYADALDEALIGQRAREVAEAQSALVALRARTELRVRRVLSPAQLQTFRALRMRARRNQRMQRRLNEGVKPQRPESNLLDNNVPLSPNPQSDQKPDARPLTLRERRRGRLRRP